MFNFFNTPLQVQQFVSKLTPEQVKLQQQMVIEHVNKQAQEQHLDSIEKAELLAQTLAHNGLPQVNSPVENSIASVVNTVAQGETVLTNLVSSIIGDATVAEGGPVDHVPGLPVPGTLEHSLTLALFKAQQAINNILEDKPNQPAVDNKIGVAAEAATDESSANGDPIFAALGLLTTGAVGTVIYSYLMADNNLASSVSALAKGAVDAIKRNDIVQAAKNAIASVTGNKFEDESDLGNLDYDNYDTSVGYSDYGYGYPPPMYSLIRKRFPHSIPDNIEFYEPETKVPDVPYITYTEDHSPWEFIKTGQSTDHLYRSFST